LRRAASYGGQAPSSLPRITRLQRTDLAGLPDEARSAKSGGIFSVPLSFRLPWPGVTRRTALRSSDFPPTLRRAAVWLAAKVWLYRLVMADG